MSVNVNVSVSVSVQGHPALAGITVLERGWLSSNNILIHAVDGETGATLVDTGHLNHAAQTVALVRQALAGAPLARIVNTHLHSDHCGGNATLQREFGADLFIPPGLAEAVHAWDHTRLSYAATGQRIERFTPQGVIRPGDRLAAGGRRFEVLPAPGHDPESVMLFDAAQGLLISADALWEFGFGVVFPEIAGEPGFDDVGAVLDAIERLPVALVVPGHGAPFTDVTAALARSRSRLAAFKTEPAKHAKHAVKVLIKYHVMEERAEPLDALLAWAAATPLLVGVWDAHGRALAASPQAWCEQLVHELVGGGVLALEGGVVSDL